ncbi:P-loop containing nucleoside triphosphate hydrolase protein, partial [Earliella scabrosa]
MPPSSAGFLFSSVEGYALVRGLLARHLSYTPHDYQLEGVCKVLDGSDLVAVLPTGAGKTGYFTFYLLLLLAIAHDTSLQPLAPHVPQDPCVLMVYPTNGLEEEQAKAFDRVGIKSLVINSDSVSRARKDGRDLWVVARKEITVILLSPEQLATPGFDSLLQQPTFQSRLCAIGIDEVHLLYSWGQSFRKAYRQIGHVRARLPMRTRLMGTTATLLAGHPEQTVFSFLGLRKGEFHFIRRSNLRRNVRTIFRIVTHGLGGWSFPDLKWVLAKGRKTVIHCRTIVAGFRLAIYLLQHLPAGCDSTKRVRLYNALNWPSYNAETRRLMLEDDDAQIIIATAAFMVGIDLPNIADVIILGPLQSADEHVQWEGRAGRDPRVVADARCITLVTKKTMQTARDVCAGKVPRGGKATGGKKATAVMDLSMARLLCAECVSAEQDVLYDNPPSETPCSCPGCSRSQALMSSLPPWRCDCSGCDSDPEETVFTGPSRRRDTNPVPKKKRLSKL